MMSKLTAEELEHIKFGVEQAQAGRLVRGFAQAGDILGSFKEVLGRLEALEQELRQATDIIFRIRQTAQRSWDDAGWLYQENSEHIDLFLDGQHFDDIMSAMEQELALKDAEISGLREALFAAKDYLESWGPVDGDERYIDASDTLMDVLDIALGPDARGTFFNAMIAERQKDKALKLAEEVLLTQRLYVLEEQEMLTGLHKGRGDNPEACSSCVIIANRLDEIDQALAALRKELGEDATS